MSAYSNVPFALADGDFLGNIWGEIEKIGSGIIDQGTQKAEETGKSVIDNWMNYGQNEIGGMLSPGGNTLPTMPGGGYEMSPANPNLGPMRGLKPEDGGGSQQITATNESFIKNPFVLGGAGLGIAKLAGLNWGYSLAIGAATYFIAPKLLENVNI